jgi:hypothetical protein
MCKSILLYRHNKHDYYYSYVHKHSTATRLPESPSTQVDMRHVAAAVDFVFWIEMVTRARIGDHDGDRGVRFADFLSRVPLLNKTYINKSATEQPSAKYMFAES